MTLPVQATGIAWYLEADYDEIRRICTDGDQLPRSFLQWQDKAEQVRKREIREGKIVVKAHIDPKTFPGWCNANGCNVDADGRMKLASAEAYRIVMEQKKG